MVFFQVKSTSGDTFLGGDDYDQRLIDYLADEFKKEHQIDLRQDRQALQRLKEAAEKAKIELSSVMQSEINLPYITADASGPKHLVTTITRAKFEQLTNDLTQRTLRPIHQALADANLKTSEINEVVLVGGMTRMPAVQELVRKEFAMNPIRVSILTGGCRWCRHPGRRARRRSERHSTARCDPIDPFD